MSAQNITPGVLLKQFNDLADGLETKAPGGQASLVVDGVSIPVPELIAEVRGYAKLYQDVEDAGKAHEVALSARAAIEDRAKRRRESIRAAIKGALGRTNPELTSYGLTPDREHRSLTVEEEALKVAKAKATRAARHTMGKRQKLAIKGEVPPKTEV